MTQSLGGQAGIIANQMAALQAKSVVYTSLLSPQQAQLFDRTVLTPVVSDGQLELVPVRQAARTNEHVKVNWIFEYGKGVDFRFGNRIITTPRANRVIMATRPKDAVMAFGDGFDKHLPALGEKVDVAFMAGYHYAAPEGNGDRDFASYMAYTKHSLWQFARRNPYLRIHYEYVPAKHEDLEPTVLRTVNEMMNSFGINENEIRRVLCQLGYPALADSIEECERAFTLYEGALALLRELQVDRIHVHNLGYYVLVLRKPYPVSMQDVLDASLYASTVNATKARRGGYPSVASLVETVEMPLSEVGYAQLDSFANEVREQAHQVAEGIWDFDDHYAVVVPAHVCANPVSTVGMGDTISSVSYAMEVQSSIGGGAGRQVSQELGRC